MSTRSSTSRSPAKRSSAATGTAAARLAESVETLAGIGPAIGRTLRGLGIRTVFDLACTVPTGAVDLRAPLVGDAVVEHARARRDPVAIRGVVEKASIVPMRGRRAIRVALRSGTVLVELWWFFFAQSARTLAGELTVIGAPTLDAKRAKTVRIVHPRVSRLGESGGVEPTYAIPGVGSARISAALLGASFDGFVDPCPERPKTGGASFSSLLQSVHAPDDPSTHAAACARLRERLAWAEAVWLVSRRVERERVQARARRLPRSDPSAVERALAITFTASQRRAIDEIAARLDGERPSRTLLTGDVGTGKTAVVLAAIAQAIAAGAQVVVLAPTSVLAEQWLAHVHAVAPRSALIPRVAGPGRDALIAAVREHRIDVVVGSHAVLSGELAFAELGLVVVDEQQRLGVGQRLALVSKGEGPHLISVSATPIPRTLAIALRGEIATAHLDERPHGRTLAETRVLPRGGWDGVVSVIQQTVARGERVFVVCASISGSQGATDDDETTGAIARAKELKKAKLRVALVHGALEDEEVSKALASFREGRTDVLVGTSILEVGVDVPEATLIVVDGADRFGLAQLHQLRGRVGRGERPGLALLVHDEQVSERARERLAAVAVARDGLEVAKADLALRGGGDLDGVRQSGEASGLRWLDPLGDEAIARSAAEWVGVRGGIDADDPALEGLRRVMARLDGVERAVASRRDAG